MTATEGPPLQLDQIAEAPPLQLDEIQGIVLRDRPSPYVGTYILLRVDDPRAGPELMRRLAELVDSAANWWQPALPALLNVGLTYPALEALEVPPTSLTSFPEEFRQDMAARAESLGDTGDGAPARWEPPFGTGQVHVVLSLLAANQESLATVLERARQARGSSPTCRLSIARTSTNWLRAAPASATRIASATPRSKAAARPARPVMVPRSRPASSCWAIPIRPETCRRCQNRRCWAATARSWPGASCTPASPPTDPTLSAR